MRRNKENQLISKDEIKKLHTVVGPRDESSTHQLSHLKPIHKDMIAAHLSGMRNKDIALKFGRSEQTVSRVLNDPLAKKYLEIGYLSYEQDLRSLYGVAIEACRGLLESSDKELQGKGIDKLDKLSKLLTPEGREISKGGSVSVNIRGDSTGEKKEDAVERLIKGIEMIANKPSNSRIFNVDGEAEVVDVEEVEKETKELNTND